MRQCRIDLVAWSDRSRIEPCTSNYTGCCVATADSSFMCQLEGCKLRVPSNRWTRISRRWRTQESVIERIQAAVEQRWGNFTLQDVKHTLNEIHEAVRRGNRSVHMPIGNGINHGDVTVHGAL